MHEFRAFPTVHVCPPEQFSLEGSFLEEQRLQPKGGKAMSAVPMRRPPFLWKNWEPSSFAVFPHGLCRVMNVSKFCQGKERKV